ncbi:MAG: ATPase, T2SS/T4P/T4SS family [bacterium]
MPKALANLTDFPHGLVLFTGPTGCGKTSTMAALLNLINMSKSVISSFQFFTLLLRHRLLIG